MENNWRWLIEECGVGGWNPNSANWMAEFKWLAQLDPAFYPTLPGEWYVGTRGKFGVFTDITFGPRMGGLYVYTSTQVIGAPRFPYGYHVLP